MEATAPLFGHGRLRALLDAVDLQALAVWLLGFLLVVYLGLNGGGYDPIVRNQLGIAIWWGIMLGLAVGALPLNRLRAGSWVAFGLLGAYVGWVALSYTWTDTPAGTLADLGRVTTYLGVFALALGIRSSRGMRRMVSAVGAGIAVLSLVALLSRLHPAWFPDADETVRFLTTSRSRLAYPLGYWNGVASLTAIGLPLVLYAATGARHTVSRAIAAAALPAMALTIYFTFSRGGTLAALVAVALFLALVPDRLPRLTTLAIAAVGAAILIVGAHQREALDAGLAGAAARNQGDSLLAMTAVVCLGVGLIQAGLTVALREGRRPAWTRPSRRTSLALLAGAVAVALLAGIAAGAPGKASHAWHEFTAAKSVGNGPGRFGSFSSNGRWPLWQSALKENATDPLVGTGSGSFEGWWAQHGTSAGFVKDAHSLYFETLGELGIVGLAFLAAFLAWILLAGVRRYAHASSRRRAQLSAALAGCAAFCLAVAYDWLWEIAVIPIAFLLLASVLVSAGERRRTAPTSVPLRIAGVALAVAAVAAIAIPLSSASSLQQSRAAARVGNPVAALEQARDAGRVETRSATPLTQEALVLESQRLLAPAASAIKTATEREPDEWQAWVIRSRIEAERGNARASVSAYRRARSLNPNSPIFR